MRFGPGRRAAGGQLRRPRLPKEVKGPYQAVLSVTGPHQPSLTPRRSSLNRSLVRAGVVVAAAAVVLVAATPAMAAPGAPTLSSVIDKLRNWLMSLLAALATLFLTVGGLRYMTAGGDPGQIERVKTALKSAAIGYALAALSPILVQILRSVVGA